MSKQFQRIKAPSRIVQSNQTQQKKHHAMQNTNSPTRIWIGHWLLFVAAIHTLVALFAFQDDWVAMGHLGFFNTVGRDPQRGAVAFFLLFGFVLALLAQSVTALERSGQHAALRKLGWSFLGVCAVGLLLMPSSGFWLAAPALVAMLRKHPPTAST